jgi:hypothetical protein
MLAENVTKKVHLGNPGYQVAILPPRLNSKYAQPEVLVLLVDCPVEITIKKAQFDNGQF